MTVQALTERPTELYGRIQERMIANVGAAGGRPPSFGIGSKDVASHFNAPNQRQAHVSWVPMGGQVRIPHAPSVRVTRNPRKLWDRRFATAAYIWAPDVDAANDLVNHLVASIDDLMHGVYRVIEEKWEISSDSQAGNIVVIIFEMFISFTTEKLPSVHPTAVAVNGSIVQPEDLS